MTQALESIVSSCTNEPQLELKLGGRLFPKSNPQNGERIQMNGINGDDYDSTEDQEFTIQIVQKVNHPIDTLCWLHANQPRIEALNPLPAQKPPILYLSNAENTFEAASVGSALTIHDLHDTHWDIIQSLPEGSGVYGGKRFDTDGEISDEWKEFGKERT